MSVREREPLRLADGRVITWCEVGPADSQVTALCLHGTGASRLEVAPYADTAARHGVRIVAWDRPRHGGSTPLPGRTIADVVADARAVVAAAELGRPAVFGTSGGGTHAVALACLAPDLIRRAVTINAGAPAEPRILAAMPPQLAKSIRLAESHPGRLRLLARITQSQNPLLRRLALRGLHPLDRKVVEHPTIGPLLEASAAQGRRQKGAWIEEALMFWGGPWPFDYRQLRVPLDAFAGDDDPFRPFALALVEAGATLHEFPGGHASGFLPENLDAVVAVLAQDAPQR